MPLLTLTKDGEIYEVDARLDGAQGMGRGPELVEADDVTSLSLVEDNKALRDKAAVRKLKYLQAQNKYKQYAQQAGKEIAKQKLSALMNEKRFNKAKQQAYLAGLYKNQSYLTARQQGGLPEKMSGVTGYGFTADGRRPVGSQASLDWNPVLQANTAFGGKAQDWGHETAFGIHSDNSVQGLGDYTWPSTINKDDQGNWISNTFYELNEPSTMTQKDQFILESFDNGSYTAPWFSQYKLGEFNDELDRLMGRVVITSQVKDQIESYNKNWVGGETMARYARQGWGWSAYQGDDGKIHYFKVAYHYGLPMVDPENKTPAYRDLYYLFSRSMSLPTNSGWSSQFVRYPGVKRNKNIFNALWPVLMAAHREYFARSAEMKSLYDPEGYKTGYAPVPGSQSATAPTAVRVGGGSIFQNLFKALFGDVKAPAAAGVNYNHPLLKQGLLKGKK